MMNINERFLTLMNDLGVSHKNAQLFLQSLLTHYNESQRFYHTLNHIIALLKLFDTVKNQLNHPTAVELAIFYHDIIYDPQRTDNEKQSAELMQQQLQHIIDNKILTTAYQLIMMTQKHKLAENLAETALNDARYFLDMDLAILGSDKKTYQSYAKAIRQEYAHFSDDDYKKGRCMVLTNFLQRPRLFFSDYFFDRLETIARQNLQQELAQLIA